MRNGDRVRTTDVKIGKDEIALASGLPRAIFAEYQWTRIAHKMGIALKPQT
jgi:hypothetical protein